MAIPLPAMQYVNTAPILPELWGFIEANSAPFSVLNLFDFDAFVAKLARKFVGAFDNLTLLFDFLYAECVGCRATNNKQQWRFRVYIFRWRIIRNCMTVNKYIVL